MIAIYAHARVFTGWAHVRGNDECNQRLPLSIKKKLRKKTFLPTNERVMKYDVFIRVHPILRSTKEMLARVATVKTVLANKK